MLLAKFRPTATPMDDLLKRTALCVERGKINANSPYPPDLQGQDGADELTKKALASGISPHDVLTKGLMVGMMRVSEMFRERKIFVPDVLMAAKAMHAAMVHLKPYFNTAQVKHRGTMVIGTVRGDLHDIGKKIVAMVVEGAGWEVVDLGTDVSAGSFIKAIREHPGCVVGLSALLTTTMVSMEQTVKEISSVSPETKIIVGGAPVTEKFARKIGADAYSPDPQGAVEFLNALLAGEESAVPSFRHPME